MIRVEKEVAFILNSRPLRERSRIVYAFTPHFGKISLVMQSAGKKNARIALIQPFQEVSIGFSGKTELCTLRQIDAVGQPLMLEKKALYIGLYMNELLYRLMHFHIESVNLYQHYAKLLAILAESAQHPERLEHWIPVRKFELTLLKELGYAIDFSTVQGSKIAIEPAQHYHYAFSRGFVASQEGPFKGAELLAIANDLWSLERAQIVRSLTRYCLHYLLQGKPLHSREICKLQNFLYK